MVIFFYSSLPMSQPQASGRSQNHRIFSKSLNINNRRIFYHTLKRSRLKISNNNTPCCDRDREEMAKDELKCA